MNPWALWRSRWRTWVPALVFLAVNLGGLALYNLVYRDRVTVLDQRLRRLQGHHQGLSTRRAELEARVARVQKNRESIETLYREGLSTERSRLTKTLAEFKTLASRAGLTPQTVSYPEEELAQFGLVKKSIVFGVDGTYNSLRQLIHLLELSPTFFALEEVRLGEAGASSQRLKISLRLATMFVSEAPSARPPLARPETPKTPPDAAKPAPVTGEVD